MYSPQREIENDFMLRLVCCPVACDATKATANTFICDRLTGLFSALCQPIGQIRCGNFFATADILPCP